MSVKRIERELESRFARILSGLDIGFADPLFSERLRNLRGGTWMTVELTDKDCDLAQAMLPRGTAWGRGPNGEFPFEDGQFEVVVIDGEALDVGTKETDSLIREIHRVLLPGGSLFFEMNGALHRESDVFKLLRYGFDVVSVHRSGWWRFWRPGCDLMVCAQKKKWREHEGFVCGLQAPFSSMGRRK